MPVIEQSILEAASQVKHATVAPPVSRYPGRQATSSTPPFKSWETSWKSTEEAKCSTLEMKIRYNRSEYLSPTANWMTVTAHKVFSWTVNVQKLSPSSRFRSSRYHPILAHDLALVPRWLPRTFAFLPSESN